MFFPQVFPLALVSHDQFDRLLYCTESSFCNRSHGQVLSLIRGIDTLRHEKEKPQRGPSRYPSQQHHHARKYLKTCRTERTVFVEPAEGLSGFSLWCSSGESGSIAAVLSY